METLNLSDTSLADIATQYAGTSSVLRKHRLDFCCGGKQTLRAACDSRNLNLPEVLAELATFVEKETAETNLPLPELTDFIVRRYHEDLRRRIPELILLADKVERVHGDHPDCPAGLAGFLTVIRDELEAHMLKEERILFPLIKAGKGTLAQMPIKVMTMDHDAHGAQLERLHEMTKDFTPPDGACPTWVTLYRGLDKLEQELMEHIHLENHVLFTRALA